MSQKSQSLLLRSAAHSGTATQPRTASLRTLLRFVQLEVVQQMGKVRWWFVFPISIGSTYLLLSNMLTRASQQALQLNVWDGLFIFADVFLVIYVLTPFYLYLVSDLVAESWFTEAVVRRLQSRRQWWIGKVATLGVLTGMYVSVLAGVTGAIVSLVLPWQNQWSQHTVQQPQEMYLPSAALTFPPVHAFSLLLLLLALGWFSLGLMVLVGGRLLGNARWGFGIGLLITLSNAIVLHTFIPPPYSNIFINHHLLFIYHAFGDSTSAYPSLALSLLYWLMWMVVLFPAGWWLHVRHNFLRSK